MSRIAFLLPALLLSACASVSAQEAPVTGTGECSNEGLDRFVGQQRSAQLEADLRKASGANVVQFIGPDELVTMEFRADRLRVQLDASGKVQSARCG